VNIDPGAGYRLLQEGELIFSSDEINNSQKWRQCNDSVGHRWNKDDWFPVRRKLPGKVIRLYTTCDDLGVINGAVVYATERDVANDNVREIKVDPSTGTLYVEAGHGRPTGEA
jgi:hypothetical protein